MEADCLKPDNSHISCLFPEILAMIFTYLDIKEKGRVSQVCVTWRDAAYSRMVWRGVVAKLHLKRANPSLFSSLVKRGVTRVQILSIRRSLKDVIHGITGIRSLNLSGCYNVTDIALGHAFVSEVPSLRVLDLSLCKQVTDSSLGRISQYLKNLEVLELGGCSNVTSTGMLVCAWGLRKLKSINLRSCRHVSDTGIGHLAGITPNASNGNLHLEHLGLQDCQKLTDQSLKSVGSGLSSLKSINLSFCGSVTDSGLKYLAKMPNLTDINLRSCDNISDIGIGYLSDGSSIKTLDVSFCERISDQTLVHISQGLFSVRSLSVCACSISDEGLEKLVRTCHDLKTLNIGQCNCVTDKGLALIAEHLKNLVAIDLYGCNKITTVGLEKIMQLKKLASLNLGLWNSQEAKNKAHRSSANCTCYTKC